MYYVSNLVKISMILSINRLDEVTIVSVQSIPSYIPFQILIFFCRVQCAVYPNMTIGFGSYYKYNLSSIFFFSLLFVQKIRLKTTPRSLILKCISSQEDVLVQILSVPLLEPSSSKRSLAPQSAMFVVTLRPQILSHDSTLLSSCENFFSLLEEPSYYRIVFVLFLPNTFKSFDLCKLLTLLYVGSFLGTYSLSHSSLSIISSSSSQLSTSLLEANLSAFSTYSPMLIQ